LIGIDTNVLVRFLTQDDPTQSAAAIRLLQDAEAKRVKVRINLLILLETVWVLRSAYGHSSAAVLSIVERLLESPPLEVESAAQVRQALACAREFKHELPDALIGILNYACKTTWTFDAKAAKLPGFTLLKG
jgi:predicted nucleic-acid-binding protein